MAEPSCTVELRTGPAALELLDERWDELLALQPLPNPTLSAAWLRRLAEWKAGEPLVVAAERDGRLVAAAPLQLRRRGGVFGVWVASWLGPVEQLCSPELLVHPEHPDAALDVVAAVLEEADALALAASGGGPAAASVRVLAPWHHAADLGFRWTVEWPPPRRDYAARRAGAELRRAAKLGADVEVRIWSEPDELAHALVRLFRVHRERWQERDDETLRFARTRALRRWNAELVATMAAAGGARIAEVVEDGRTVAACLGFVHGRGGIAHTQAMRPGGALREPGHLALFTCIEALAAAGATRVELGPGQGGPGTPKGRLGASPEPLHALFAARRPARQRLFSTAQRLQHALRQ